jgi:hypothetical protein
VMFSGREARKALSMFMVRGTCFVADVLVHGTGRQVVELGVERYGTEEGEMLTPLNPIHFNPTSLINSAVATAS